MRDLITAANRRLVLSSEVWRPRKTDGGREIVLVARPEAEVGILAVLADENDFRQAGFRHAAVMEPFTEGTAGNSEVAGVAVSRAARPVRARAAAKIRDAEQVPADSEVQREIRADFPVV